jgi:Flp pilus assembly protein TadD
VDDARDAFLDALALAGPDVGSQVAAAGTAEDARLALAGGVEGKGQTAHALSTQREADVFERSLSTGVLLTHLASALLQRGDSKGAVEALRSAIRLQPKLGEAYYQMGKCSNWQMGSTTHAWPYAI